MAPSRSRTKEVLHLPRDLLRRLRRAPRQYLSRATVDRDDVLRLHPVVVAEVIVKAPLVNRIKLFQQLYRSLSTRLPASLPEICEINSLGDFESFYNQFAAMLGHAGKTPPLSELEFLEDINTGSTQYQGRISMSDCLFLTSLASILAPLRVIEVGTLTGWSAAVLAAALHRQHGDDGAIRVDTIDVSARCVVDETRPTGFEIAETFPELAGMIRLHYPYDSSIVAELAEPDEMELVFIDADHRHPMPLLDLLRIAPYLKAGGWVALHDIRLGTIGREARKAGQTFRWGTSYGAEWLFDYWPWRKISGGNIGAVQIPNEKSELIPFALRLMSIRFELDEKHVEKTRRALYHSFDKLV